MKIVYDPKADALYIKFIDTTVTTENVAEGIALDYAEDGRLAGIEILDAGRRLGDKESISQATLQVLDR